MLNATYWRPTLVATPSVTLDELKGHLGIYDETEFDAELTRILAAATQLVIQITGEFPELTEVQAFYGGLITGDYVLPNRYVNSVLSVQTYDGSHNLVTLVAGTDYYYDPTGIRPRVGILGSLDLSDRFENPVIITYEAELPIGSITEAIAQATLSLIHI